MGGRRPTPTALKILRGNPGQRRLNTREPKPEPLEVACPVELTDPAAVAEWTRAIVPAIHRRQVTSADRVAAIAHCALWATWLLEDRKAGAWIVELDRHGRPVANPARRMANQTLQLLLRYDADLGFTPSSRSRVQTATADPVANDKWSGLLSGT